MTVYLAILAIATFTGLVQTVPPPQCLANFRWDDCGKPPRTVIYYWRVASRCEVGIWRGCLPNMNMFKDEYECVSTCTFSVRASAQDFHQLNAIEDDTTTENYEEGYSEVDNSTDENDLVDSTTLAGDITTDAANEGGDKEEGGDDKKEDKDPADEDGKDTATEADAEKDNEEKPDNPEEPEEQEEPKENEEPEEQEEGD